MIERARARARGQRLGRHDPPKKVAYALQLLAEPGRSMFSIAKLLGVSRSTLYKALPELTPPRPASRPTRQPSAPPAPGQHDQLLAALPRLLTPSGGPGHDKPRQRTCATRHRSDRT